jgi:hypothetical protein
LSLTSCGGLPSRPCRFAAAGQPDFLEFSSRNAVRWKYGVNYTLTNGLGKQGNYPPAAGASLDHGEQF